MRPNKKLLLLQPDEANHKSFDTGIRLPAVSALEVAVRVMFHLDFHRFLREEPVSCLFTVGASRRSGGGLGVKTFGYANDSGKLWSHPKKIPRGSKNKRPGLRGIKFQKATAVGLADARRAPWGSGWAKISLRAWRQRAGRAACTKHRRGLRSQFASYRRNSLPAGLICFAGFQKSPGVVAQFTCSALIFSTRAGSGSPRG